MSSEAPGVHRQHDDDERLLHKLGYAQVLYREMGGFSNFAISFTIISILAGCLTSYYIAFQWGGPVAITWGWLLVGGFCIIVALAMGEIASTYPTAGGLYFWASKLGSPAWGWFTGWFNLIGQIAVTAAIDYGAAIFTTSLLNLWFPGIPNTRHAIFVTFTVIIFLHLLINLLGVKLLAGLNSISAWWHMAGVAVIVAILIIVPDHHQSVSYVFTKTINNSGFSGHGWHSPVFWFVFGLGLLMSQYTITGYDASAHMSEETRNASRAAAWGIVMSVVVSVIFGFALLVAVTFAIPSTQGGLDAGANIVTYIWQTSMSTKWAEFLLVIAVRRAVLLRHGVGDVGVADDVRVLPRRRDPGPPVVEPRERGSRAHLRGVRDRRAVVAAHGPDVLEQRRRLPRRHLDRRDRALHRVRAPDHPALAPGRSLRARPVEPRQALQVDRRARDRVDRGDLRPVPDADHADGHPVEDGLQLERRQLRADHGRRRAPALRRLVRAVGAQVVQRPGSAGLRGRARADRIGLRHAPRLHQRARRTSVEGWAGFRPPLRRPATGRRAATLAS